MATTSRKIGRSDCVKMKNTARTINLLITENRTYEEEDKKEQMMLQPPARKQGHKGKG